MQAGKILAKLTGRGSAGLVVREGISDFEDSGSVFTYRARRLGKVLTWLNLDEIQPRSK